jgi:hypothetical protein
MSRPITGKTNSSSFYNSGSNNLNINPKVSHYHSNGSGRDSYIKIDNGGFRKAWDNSYKNMLSCI